MNAKHFIERKKKVTFVLINNKKIPYSMTPVPKVPNNENDCIGSTNTTKQMSVRNPKKCLA